MTANLYDHLLVHNKSATRELVENSLVLDVPHVATTKWLFFQTGSEQLPIMVQARSFGPDDDP